MPSNRTCRSALALTLVLLVAGAAPAGAAPVLLISIDGLMPEAYLTPDKLGLVVPNLRALVREGAWARGAVSVTPSITFPAHTTMVTGVNPSRHGVLSNEVFDPDGKLGGGWNWYAGDVKVPTLFDRAREAELKTASVTWPATAGAPIDLNLPDMYPVATLREARNLLSLSRIGPAGSILEEVLPAVESLIRLRDDTRIKVAVRFLKERPDFMAVHFLELDDAQHASGPRSPEAVAMIERLDAHLGTLFDELRALGRFEETTILLVSDHGFLPIEKEVRVGTLLRTLGLLEADSQGRVTTWKAFFWPQGGSAAIYLHPLATVDDRRKVDDVLRLLQANPAWGVGRVLRGADLAALGGLAGAYAVMDALPGFCFGRAVDAPELIGPKLGGIHGHLPSRPDLRASFIARGPGIRKNHDLGLVRLLDIAPTVAKVLGVNMGKIEGRVLGEAFVKPAAPVRVGARPAPPAPPVAR